MKTVLVNAINQFDATLALRRHTCAGLKAIMLSARRAVCKKLLGIYLCVDLLFTEVYSTRSDYERVSELQHQRDEDEENNKSFDVRAKIKQVNSL